MPAVNGGAARERSKEILALFAADAATLGKGTTTSPAEGITALFACGKNKVFLRKKALEALEMKRARIRQRAARTLQARVRGMWVRHLLLQPIEAEDGMAEHSYPACSPAASVSVLDPASPLRSPMRASWGIARSNLARWIRSSTAVQ